jgi:hypothetical protein
MTIAEAHMLSIFNMLSLLVVNLSYVVICTEDMRCIPSLTIMTVLMSVCQKRDISLQVQTDVYGFSFCLP